ncbi:MAG: Ig-like domain-containing protein [Lachnospiraceae bacterium]|nr:Ig-like domain-containing protein [Lachnospiraceae bacterium]
MTRIGQSSEAASATVTIKEAASPAADPASPVHKTDGSNIEKVEKDSAKYSFNVNVNTAAISFTKENIRLGFSEIRDIPEYSLVAEHRYRSSNKRIASVNKSGLMRPKKCGEVDIIYEQREKGGAWKQVGESLHIYVQRPKMEKKATVTHNATELSGYDYLSHTTYSPTRWVSSNKKVATIDKDGNITVHSPGSTLIIAEYKRGWNGTKKRYKTRLTVLK